MNLQTQTAEPEVDGTITECRQAIKNAIISAERLFGTNLMPATLLLVMALREVDERGRAAIRAEQRKTAGGAR